MKTYEIMPLGQDSSRGTLRHAMPGSSTHRPASTFQIGYDPEGLTVEFGIIDRFMCALVNEHQGPVCRDSCVEFFFSPWSSADRGYFNIEVNCLGVMLFQFQREPRKNPVDVLPADDFGGMQIVSSLQAAPVEDDEVSWWVRYRVPYDVLTPFATFPVPTTGDRWRANVYKCADDSSHPHWLTWAPIDAARPDFHRPDAFGTLVFA